MTNTDEWFKDRLRKKWNLPESTEIDLSGLKVEPAPQKCFECGKPFTRDFKTAGFSHRLCPECLKASNERAAPRDCQFCQGKQTVQATYQGESEYGEPYICHACLKDVHGNTWEHIPGHAIEVPMYAPGGYELD